MGVDPTAPATDAAPAEPGDAPVAKVSSASAAPGGGITEKILADIEEIRSEIGSEFENPRAPLSINDLKELSERSRAVSISAKAEVTRSNYAQIASASDRLIAILEDAEMATED